MIVLVGDTRAKRIVTHLQTLGWGRMFGGPTHHPTPYPNEPWGFDNGAFAAWKQGTRLDESRFLWRLEKAMNRGTPYLAVCPDLPASGLRSLEYSCQWRERLPSWPWYLALQDGMTEEAVRPVAPAFAGLFLGGTLRFKSTALTWVALAHALSRPVHFARAGTLARAAWAQQIGADSLDSTTPLWTEPRFLAFVDTMQNGPAQRSLF